MLNQNAFKISRWNIKKIKLQLQIKLPKLYIKFVLKVMKCFYDKNNFIKR